MSMQTTSPRLLALIKRNFSEDQCSVLDELFTFTQQYLGKDEIDFKRDPEQSFNPRYARIPTIIFLDAPDHANFDAVCAAIIANLNNELLIDKTPATETSRQIAKIAIKSPQEILTLKETVLDNVWKSAALIATILYLDRARHIHLKDNNSNIDAFLNQSIDAISLAQIVSKTLYGRLINWKNRQGA